MTSRTITTDATASREARPELATVDVTAIGEGDAAATARQHADDRAATVRESLAETGVSDERIRTVSFRIADSSQLFDGDVPYRATKRLCVDCTPDTAAAVVTVATDAGGTVPAVSFALRDDVRRELEREALEAAMERARERAERLAAAEDVTLAGVEAVTTTDAGAGMEGLVDEALANADDAAFRPEPIAVTETVEVVYRLADE